MQIKVLIIHYDDILKIDHYFITYIKIHFYFKCFIKHIKNATPPSKGIIKYGFRKTFKTFPDKCFLTTSKLLLCWCIWFLKKSYFKSYFFSQNLIFLDLHLVCCVKWDTTWIQYAKVSKHLSSHKSSKNVKHLLPLWDSM